MSIEAARQDVIDKAKAYCESADIDVVSSLGVDLNNAVDALRVAESSPPLDRGFDLSDEQRQAVERADTWKQIANEYAECLQGLVMGRLYDACRPVSHSWPGKKHVDGIVEGVDFLISRLSALQGECDRLRWHQSRCRDAGRIAFSRLAQHLVPKRNAEGKVIAWDGELDDDATEAVVEAISIAADIKFEDRAVAPSTGDKP